MTDMPLQLVIIGLVVVVMVIAITGYLLVNRARADKGSVKIFLDSQTWHLGKPVTGNLVVEAVAEIEINKLTIEIIAYAQREHLDDDHHVRTVETRAWKSGPQPLSENSQIRAGETRKFPFRVNMPSLKLDKKDERKIRKAFAEDMSRFEIRARLDCPGIDLHAEETLITIRTESYQ